MKLADTFSGLHDLYTCVDRPVPVHVHVYLYCRLSYISLVNTCTVHVCTVQYMYGT